MNHPFTLGIDLGGTQLRVGVVDQQGRVLRRAAVPTDVAGGPKTIVAQMLRLAHEVKQDATIAAAGISSPGPLDSDTGITLDLPSLPGWNNFPLRDVLARALGLPVTLENDGIAAAVGEWKFGAGRGFNNIVYATISTGIGGGVIANGHVLRGRGGLACHIGHMMIMEHGPVCGCGGTGCFEVLASGTAFSAAARAAGFADATAVTAAARLGDTKAKAVVAREAELLGYGFASILHLYSPERLIMGGGVSSAFDLLAPGIRAQIDRHAIPAFRAVEIVPAGLGDNAGLVGAAALATLHNAPGPPTSAAS